MFMEEGILCRPAGLTSGVRAPTPQCNINHDFLVRLYDYFRILSENGKSVNLVNQSILVEVVTSIIDVPVLA